MESIEEKFNFLSIFKLDNEQKDALKSINEKGIKLFHTGTSRGKDLIALELMESCIDN